MIRSRLAGHGEACGSKMPLATPQCANGATVFYVVTSPRNEKRSGRQKTH